MPYFAPETREELVHLLRQMPDTGRIIAGGTDLIPALRKARGEEPWLLYPGRIPEMKDVALHDTQLRVGACVTVAETARTVKNCLDLGALFDACTGIGSPQIRNKGTLVGNICTASPAGDILPVAELLGASVEILDAAGAIRMLSLSEFLLGVHTVALRRGETVTALAFERRPDTVLVSAFCKIGSRAHVSIARESAGMLLRLDPDGTILRAKLVLGAVGDKPVPADAEPLLVGKHFEEMPEQQISLCVAEAVHSHCRPKNRLYKTEAAKGLTADLLARIRERARNAVR